MSSNTLTVEPIRTQSPQLNAIRRDRGFHWWYPAIIDRMLAHPEWTKQQIASDLGVSYSTIALVTTCDLFRAHYEKRRRELSDAHDLSIRNKLSRAANATLDKIVETVESKPVGSIPLQQLTELADTVLNRLGYGAAPASAPSPVSVHVNNDARTVVVTRQDLEEARAALRANEQLKLAPASVQPPLELEPGLAADGADPAEGASAVNGDLPFRD